MKESRSIEIQRDAVGNTLITGDGNVVIIKSSQHFEESKETVILMEPSPYKGLASFNENDVDLFFGRDNLVKKLWNTFNAIHQPQSSEFKILPIIGPSGSGKSSVAKAGLIPELARKPISSIRSPLVTMFTPGPNPIQELANVLAVVATKDRAPVGKAREFADELRLENENKEFDGLSRIVSALHTENKKNIIILIDEFQEIYSLCNDETEVNKFVENLLFATKHYSQNVSIIITLRSDFLQDTQRHSKLNQAISANGVIVPAMDTASLRMTIAEPAKLAGASIDDATVDLLIAQTEGREGALPLLQFTLTRIWDGMQAGKSASQVLRQIGGVGGALAQEASAIMNSLSEQDQQIMRRVFLALVQLGEGVQDTRRRVPINEIIAAGENKEYVRKLIELFAHPEKRLISLSSDANDTTYAEITHEALIQTWGEMKAWLDLSRDDVRFHRRFSDAAKNWQKQGKPTGSLWRDPDLNLAVEYRERAANDMTDLEIAFLEASLVARENELELAERVENEKRAMQRQLAAGIAHDFNNLLTVIIGFCDLLLQRHRPGEESFADMMQIKQTANRAANLVRQLLAFSGQQTLQPKVLNITDVLAELSNLLRRLIGVNITLNVVHGRDLGLVKVDQVQLEQVIINLAVNARDAMKDGGGTLTLFTTNVQYSHATRRGTDVMPAGRYVSIAVTDTGTGICEENLGRIFDPFFSTKEIGAGTGLGLSTVYGIVRQTGGFVQVDSVEGEGTTFTIYLPLCEQTEEEREDAAATEFMPAAQDDLCVGTVLFVEDDDPVRLFGIRALRNKGYNVLEAKNGKSALEVMSESTEPIDLVISDVVMTELDGPGLVREVRNRIPRMKVIFISGYAEADFVKAIEKEHDTYFLQKPFSLKQLVSMVEKAMKS